MTQATDILSRLQAASGPDLVIDADIYARIHGYEVYAHWNGVYAVFEMPGGGWEHLEALPAYTGSLDAAMTLVPENHGWNVGSTVGAFQQKAIVGAQEAYAATPAIALCIAALQAHPRTQDKG